MRQAVQYLIATLCLIVFTAYAQGVESPKAAQAKEMEPTPVAGESWLNHLHRSFGDTSMGKTGRLGPPAPPPGEESARWQAGALTGFSMQSTTMRGADLYRLNCQGCHGDAGLGAPPEINAVVGPVRATSAQLVAERMKKTGMDISASAAGELAKQAKDALLLRLHNGGQDMPAFPHLSEAEIRALLAYLNQLAGVSSAQVGVEETPLRVGEHIVKSTCHTCHDAAGPNPTPQQLEEGAIPPLSTLTTRTDQIEFIRKVTSGAPILMGTPPTLHRGKMPVFYYLTQDEAADAYLYLSNYPPSQIGNPPAAIALAQQPQDTAPPAPPVASAPGPPVATPPQVQTASAGSNFALASMLMGMGMFVVFLMMGALGVAVFVFVTLSEDRHRHATKVNGFHAAKSTAPAAPR